MPPISSSAAVGVAVARAVLAIVLVAVAAAVSGPEDVTPSPVDATASPSAATDVSRRGEPAAASAAEPGPTCSAEEPPEEPLSAGAASWAPADAPTPD